jgi:hypothetical protein
MRPNYGSDRRAGKVFIDADAKHPDGSDALAAEDAGEGLSCRMVVWVSSIHPSQ